MFNESRAFEARFVMLAAEERYRDVPQPLLAERGNASYASKLCQVLLGFLQVRALSRPIPRSRQPLYFQHHLRG